MTRTIWHINQCHTGKWGAVQSNRCCVTEPVRTAAAEEWEERFEGVEAQKLCSMPCLVMLVEEHHRLHSG